MELLTFIFPIPLSRVLKRKKSITPFRTPLPTQHIWGERKSTARLGFRKKTGNGKRGWFGPQLPGHVSCGLRCRHPPPSAVRIPPSRHGASLLPSHINRGPRSARRCGWEGVGDRGLRCQRPPPLEVGREQIHLCCLLFLWTCPAVCLSLSRSPATGRL